MSAGRCECSCLGCEHFHLDDPPRGGRDAHHTRLLLALDQSLAAACRERGLPSCNGQNDDRHAVEGCEIGSLHSRAAESAIALAAALDEPSDVHSELAGTALDALLAELAAILAGKPRLS